jgi:hypothetical protein
MISMKLTVSVFNKIRPDAVRLAAWKRQSAPQRAENPMRAIVLFARYMGIKTIPEKTMHKLRHDPYFRYCFYQLRPHEEVYRPDSIIGKESRKSILRLIKHPDSMTDKDLYYGLREYLNNFSAYLPGGFRASMFNEIAEASPGLKRIFNATDKVLEEKGLTAKATLLRNESKKETKESYAKRVEFMKLALEIFNVLVERYGFDPQELWT